MDLSVSKIGVIGLGYVGLPLAVSLARVYEVVGFDIDQKKIKSLNRGIDYTNELEVKPETLRQTALWSCNPIDLKHVEVYIVTVPTPVDENQRPDLSLVFGAIEIIAVFLNKGDIVCFESTVFPTATRTKFIPLLEKSSGLRHGDDFLVGYSPERINPGDRKHTLQTVTKVISGCSPEALERLRVVYQSCCDEVFLAKSIEIAEAAKVIENTQRDINIAFMNELSCILHALDISTTDVLEAAGTKWNFLPFRPGLVGGHCIGIDPYYLSHIAEEVGIQPEMILSGRRVNESMVEVVRSRIADIVLTKAISSPRIFFLGLTFKPNVADFRNSKALELFRALVADYGLDAVAACDPYISHFESKEMRGVVTADLDGVRTMRGFDLIVIATAHREFLVLKQDLLRLVNEEEDILDLSNILGLNKSFSL